MGRRLVMHAAAQCPNARSVRKEKQVKRFACKTSIWEVWEKEGMSPVRRQDGGGCVEKQRRWWMKTTDEANPRRARPRALRRVNLSPRN